MNLSNCPLDIAKQCFEELKIDEYKPQNVFLKMATYFKKKLNWKNATKNMIR